MCVGKKGKVPDFRLFARKKVKQSKGKKNNNKKGDIEECFELIKYLPAMTFLNEQKKNRGELSTPLHIKKPPLPLSPPLLPFEQSAANAPPSSLPTTWAPKIKLEPYHGLPKRQRGVIRHSSYPTKFFFFAPRGPTGVSPHRKPPPAIQLPKGAFIRSKSKTWLALAFFAVRR